MHLRVIQAFGSLLVFHNLNTFQVDGIDLTKACFVQSDEVWLGRLDYFLDQSRGNHSGRVWSLNIVQVVSSDIFVVVVSSGEVEHTRSDL